MPMTVAVLYRAWIFFASSKAGIVGSNLTQGMVVCVRLFCVCVVLYIGSGLVTGWSPVTGALPSVYRIKKLKKRPRSNRITLMDFEYRRVLLVITAVVSFVMYFDLLTPKMSPFLSTLCVLVSISPRSNFCVSRGNLLQALQNSLFARSSKLFCFTEHYIKRS
jgi:hypothetical protein